MTAAARAPLVSVIMGSRSDWEKMQHASSMLDELGIAHETLVVSAHRTPDRLYVYGTTPAPERTLGHVTLCSEDPDLLVERIRLLSVRLPEPIPDTWIHSNSSA